MNFYSQSRAGLTRGTDIIRPSNKSPLVVAPVCLLCWHWTREMLYQVSQCLMSRLTQARGWPAPEMAVISDTGGARGDHPVISSHIEREPAPGTVISSISTIRTGFRAASSPSLITTSHTLGHSLRRGGSLSSRGPHTMMSGPLCWYEALTGCHWCSQALLIHPDDFRHLNFSIWSTNNGVMVIYWRGIIQEMHNFGVVPLSCNLLIFWEYTPPLKWP